MKCCQVMEREREKSSPQQFFPIALLSPISEARAHAMFTSQSPSLGFVHSVFYENLSCLCCCWLFVQWICFWQGKLLLLEGHVGFCFADTLVTVWSMHSAHLFAMLKPSNGPFKGNIDKTDFQGSCIFILMEVCSAHDCDSVDILCTLCQRALCVHGAGCHATTFISWFSGIEAFEFWLVEHENNT